MYTILHYDSPLGGITVASNQTAITGLWFDGQKYFGHGLSSACEEKPTPILRQANKWLDVYFSGRAPDFTPPLFMEGISPFRRRVWEILLEIPRGSVTTYGAIAKRIAAETGKNVSAQAVGGAVGHNRVSLIVPCHRVVGADGSLTGYAGGLARKTELLQREGVNTGKLFIPKKGTAV
ncbi:MAG: 6-O-methylguanine DNA methyltransferase [Bacillota bacterium]|nr:MAG: 6-O-methylguanine DNA methyltransferase [Bacillota bacterium]